MLDARAGFLACCRLELGLSLNTLAAYTNDLTKIHAALVALGLDLAACGPDEVGRVLAWLRDERKQSAASLVRLLVTWRMYTRYLVMEKLVERDRIQLAQMPKLWNDANPAQVDRFQLVVHGWEIVNAYSELVDPIDQRKRLEDQASARQGGDEEAMVMEEDYILAMEHGMPPISGFGMGIDRFCALLTGQDNLRDVVFFPLMRPEDGIAAEAAPHAADEVKKQ